jgi:hypothetical protein
MREEVSLKTSCGYSMNPYKERSRTRTGCMTSATLATSHYYIILALTLLEIKVFQVFSRKLKLSSQSLKNHQMFSEKPKTFLAKNPSRGFPKKNFLNGFHH